MADNNIIIRIWLYPLVKKKDIYQIEDMKAGACAAILSKNHLDFLIDDSIEDIDISMLNLLKNEEFKDYKIIIFQHKSSGKKTHTKCIKKCINNSTSRLQMTVTISDGSPKNNDNYKALKEAAALYNEVTQNKKSTSTNEANKVKGYIDSDITTICTKEDLKTICQSIPEQQTNWTKYFYKIEKIDLPENANYWAFVKNGINYQLIKLENEFELFIKHNISLSCSSNMAKTIRSPKDQSKVKLNIILAPYDLNQEEYYKQLLDSIIDRNIFGIKTRNKDENYLPLLVICNKTSRDKLLFNSSIWFWALGLDDNKVDNYSWPKSRLNVIKKAIGNSERLYRTVNAKENLDYQLRLQKDNILSQFADERTSGHTIIVPKIYHDELECANTILSINTEEDEIKYKYPELVDLHDVTFRILLIDDKPDKGKQIAQLMSLGVFGDEGDRPYYKQTVWYDKKIELTSFKELDKHNNVCFNDKHTIDIDGNVKPTDDFSDDSVQIIQVTNLADAITLLSDERIRFDLILLDYLLGPKDEKKDKDDRQLSTDFFIWFQDKEGENESVNYLRKQLWDNRPEEYKNDDTIAYNKTLRELIKSNRGPLRKLWIFPITAFNETLIDDLTRNNIRLIDYYWHISKGADPITTPYLFLRMLNNFLYLQLEESVFLEHEIKKFLIKSIRRLEKVERSEDFIAVMGSEYTEFVQRFMNRSIIYRDKQNNSLFANYIWEHFFANKDYKNEHILVNYIHRFYHRCAFGGNSEYRKMILFWRDMKLFIENNFPDWTNDKELNLETYFHKLNQVYPK